MDLNIFFKKVIKYNNISFWTLFSILLIFIYHKIFNIYLQTDEYETLKYIMDIKKVFDIKLFIMKPCKINIPVFSFGLFLYWIIYNIFFLNPLPYRLLAFVCFSISILLVYFLSMAITKDKKISLTTSVLYSFSWWHCMALTWSGFLTYLSYIFVLLTFIFYVKRHFILSILTYLFSLAVKEYGILLCPILILYGIIYDRYYIVNKKAKFTILAYFSLAITSQIIKFAIIWSQGTPPLDIQYYQPIFSPHSIVTYILGYAKGFLHPITALMRYISIPNAFILVIYSISVLLFIFCFIKINKENKELRKISVFSIAWIIFFIIPFLFLRFRFSLSYMTLSSVGLYLLLSAIFFKTIKSNFIRRTGITVLLLYLCIFNYSKTNNINTYKLSIIAKNILTEIKAAYPILPKGSCIVILGLDDLWPIYYGDALRVLYKNKDLRVVNGNEVFSNKYLQDLDIVIMDKEKLKNIMRKYFNITEKNLIIFYYTDKDVKRII